MLLWPFKELKPIQEVDALLVTTALKELLTPFHVLLELLWQIS
jgi:hypothetical protein